MQAHHNRFPALLSSLALWLLCLAALPAWASDKDHELARQALQQGKVLPLRTVLEHIERQYQGQVVKVEFEHEDGRFIYTMRLLQTDGQLVKLHIDAVDGSVLSMRAKRKD